MSLTPKTTDRSLNDMTTPYLVLTTTDGRKVEWFINERRRYGRTTYTWVYYKVDGQDNDRYFDPWPGINWPKSALVWVARCEGLNVEPSKADIRWAQQQRNERRCTQILPEDAEKYTKPTEPTEVLTSN